MIKCFSIACDAPCSGACVGRVYGSSKIHALNSFLKARKFCPNPIKAIADLTVISVRDVDVTKLLESEDAEALKEPYVSVALRFITALNTLSDQFANEPTARADEAYCKLRTELMITMGMIRYATRDITQCVERAITKEYSDDAGIAVDNGNNGGGCNG